MTWRPVEPLSRTPWTADFTAAKGRAIIFGVLAVVLISLAIIASTRFEHTWGNIRVGEVHYWVGGQTHATLISESAFRSGLFTFLPPFAPYSLVRMLIDINNPQNVIFLPRATPPSGMVFFIGGLFAMTSLYCGIVARAARRRNIPGDHRSPLR